MYLIKRKKLQSSNYKFRHMKQDDVSAVIYIQSESYLPSMVESESVLYDRLKNHPDTAWVAEDDKGICAYLVTYRSVIGKVSALGANFSHFQQPNTLYLHDLAVLNRAKKRNVGLNLVRLACKKALNENLFYSALVSVQGTERFWLKLGYECWENLDDSQQVNLKTYAQPALYMVKKLQV
jgi:predicted N-acetyltransferase YhbS